MSHQPLPSAVAVEGRIWLSPAPATRSSDAEEANRDAHFERAFDPWLTCSHPEVLALGDRIITDWTAGIDRQRERALKDDDRRNREAILRAIIANVALTLAAAKGSSVAPSLGISLRAARQRSTRYDRPGFRGLPCVIELMEEAGLLSLERSRSRGTTSTVSPTDAVVAALRACDLAPENFAQPPGRETIVLSREVPSEPGSAVQGRSKPQKERLNYRDSPDSRRFRAEVQKINSFLASADMRFIPDGAPMVWTYARSLRRYFLAEPSAKPSRPRFDLSGRLFGGGTSPAWWMDLPKARRGGIRLQGERICDLDFSSMFVRLAYIEAGLAPPAEPDLYDGILGPCGARWRPGVKKVVSAMLFRTGPLTRVPTDAKEHLPEGITGRELRAAILARHPALAGVLETGIGFRLMFVESQVMVAALLRFAEAGIAALPMHDGVMVPTSKADRAADILRDAAQAVTGHALQISSNATNIGASR